MRVKIVTFQAYKTHYDIEEDLELELVGLDVFCITCVGTESKIMYTIFYKE